VVHIEAHARFAPGAALCPILRNCFDQQPSQYFLARRLDDTYFLVSFLRVGPLNGLAEAPKQSVTPPHTLDLLDVPVWPAHSRSPGLCT